MDLTLREIAAVCGGRIQGEANARILRICTDSRQPTDKQTLFFALSGPRFDGHDFYSDVLENGGSVVVSNAHGLATNANAIVVDDTTAALQKLAKHWRSGFAGVVVGITGSNGKTIVKEMLAAILGQRFAVHRSPGSFNSQVGVPLALLGIRPEHEIAIIEAGISQLGEMAQLATMIAPDCGILTSVGAAHSEGLGDARSTASEKLLLFRGSDGTVVLPSDIAPSFPLATMTVGGANAQVQARNVEADAAGFCFEIVTPNACFEARLNVRGMHNVHNALCAAAMALDLGASEDDVTDGLAAYELAPMRLEMHTTSAGVTLINDAYSSDPVSAQAALGALQYYAGGARTVAVLGDMHELGANAESLHRALGSAVGSHGIDILVAYGEHRSHIADGASSLHPDAIHMADSLANLSDVLEGILKPGDFVLFKGSRQLGLERAAAMLVDSMAPTRLHINLDAIRHNVHVLRMSLGSDVKLMAVVKSFAYGNDATRVSQTLVREGVDALAVAYPDEAVPLRSRGMRIPILVTNALADEADKIVKFDLTPLVYSEAVVLALADEATRRNVTVNLHIEVDTGMNRVGLLPSQVLDFARWIRGIDGVNVTGLMTHFAAADDPLQDAFTQAQAAAFDEVVASLTADGFDLAYVHAANTAAAWRFPSTRYDMVRVGLGLYGYHPSSATQALANATSSALEFKTRIIHVKKVPAGDTVSYGRTWQADEPRVIATIAAGYADGFPRFMSNGGEVLVHGTRCPIVGSVCMDVSMIDVTGLSVTEGDEVVLFGKQGQEEVTVDEIATRGGTINYEILCKISPRVRRLFSREI